MLASLHKVHALGMETHCDEIDTCIEMRYTAAIFVNTCIEMRYTAAIIVNAFGNETHCNQFHIGTGQMRHTVTIFVVWALRHTATMFVHA